MKVIAINGSPKKSGNTYTALKLVGDELEKEGIEIEIVHIGNKHFKGCTACGSCIRKQNEKCIIDDGINEIIQKIKEADGLLLGSPVYYSSMSGPMKSFLDRAFFVSGANGNLFRHKVGSAVVAVRRSGGMPTFNQLLNYLTYSEMVVPTSNYWNVIHGLSEGEVLQDKEGVQIMSLLGKNMAWVLKLIENGKGKVEEPQKEKKEFMNFIR